MAPDPAGIQTEKCCESTATFPSRQGGDVLSPEAINRATECALRRRLARIATVEEIAHRL